MTEVHHTESLIREGVGSKAQNPEVHPDSDPMPALLVCVCLLDNVTTIFKKTYNLRK